MVKSALTAIVEYVLEMDGPSGIGSLLAAGHDGREASILSGSAPSHELEVVAILGSRIPSLSGPDCVFVKSVVVAVGIRQCVAVTAGIQAIADSHMEYCSEMMTR